MMLESPDFEQEEDATAVPDGNGRFLCLYNSWGELRNAD